MSKNSKEKNTESETQVVTETPAADPKKEEIPHYSRCDQCIHCNNPAHIGQPSVSDQMKLKWHLEYFDNSEFQILADGRHRHYWKPKKAGYPSLKQFAKDLVSQGDQLARDWMDHKAGSLNQKRTDAKKKRVLEEKMASKAARRKPKSGGSKSTATVATA